MNTTKMMDPEIKAKWVAALRSGEYKQCKFFLEDVQGRNCCIGVLCRVQGVDPIVAAINNTKGDPLATSFLKKEYRAGLDYSCFSYLSTLNDNGRSFDQIADVIEKEF